MPFISIIDRELGWHLWAARPCGYHQLQLWTRLRKKGLKGREAPFWNVLFPYEHFPTFAWGCKGLSGWFGALFSTFARLTEGGGLKLFRQCPYRTNTYQKGASLFMNVFYHLSSPFAPRRLLSCPSIKRPQSHLQMYQGSLLCYSSTSVTLAYILGHHFL